MQAVRLPLTICQECPPATVVDVASAADRILEVAPSIAAEAPREGLSVNGRGGVL